MKSSFLRLLGAFWLILVVPVVVSAAAMVEYGPLSVRIITVIAGWPNVYTGYNVDGTDILIYRRDDNGAVVPNPLTLEGKAVLDFEDTGIVWFLDPNPFVPPNIGDTPAVCQETLDPTLVLTGFTAVPEDVYLSDPNGGDPVLIGQFITCAISTIEWVPPADPVFGPTLIRHVFRADHPELPAGDFLLETL